MNPREAYGPGSVCGTGAGTVGSAAAADKGCVAIAGALSAGGIAGPVVGAGRGCAADAAGGGGPAAGCEDGCIDAEAVEGGCGAGAGPVTGDSAGSAVAADGRDSTTPAGIEVVCSAWLAGGVEGTVCGSTSFGGSAEAGGCGSAGWAGDGWAEVATGCVAGETGADAGETAAGGSLTTAAGGGATGTGTATGIAVIALGAVENAGEAGGGGGSGTPTG